MSRYRDGLGRRLQPLGAAAKSLLAQCRLTHELPHACGGRSTGTTPAGRIIGRLIFVAGCRDLLPAMLTCALRLVGKQPPVERLDGSVGVAALINLVGVVVARGTRARRMARNNTKRRFPSTDCILAFVLLYPFLIQGPTRCHSGRITRRRGMDAPSVVNVMTPHRRRTYPQHSKLGGFFYSTTSSLIFIRKPLGCSQGAYERHRRHFVKLKLSTGSLLFLRHPPLHRLSVRVGHTYRMEGLLCILVAGPCVKSTLGPNRKKLPRSP